MKTFTCAHCGNAAEGATGRVNRSTRMGWPLYCGRPCANAAKSTGRKAIPWHQRRFEKRPGTVRVNCAGCGADMWLPPSKQDEYRSCSRECKAAVAQRRIDARTRACETCGTSFTPRQVQIDAGGGRYCSQGCNPSDHLITPENLELAQQKRRDAQAAGLIQWATGENHHSWKGGPKEAARRRVQSGKAAAELRAYRAKNKDRVREWKQRRGKGKVLHRLPWGTIPRLGELQGWKCAICRCGIRASYHVDHVTPIAKGGKHVPSNLQLLCPTCNVRKSAKDPIEYMQELGRPPMASEKPPLLGKVQFGRLVPANGAATSALSAMEGLGCRFEIKRSGANERRRGFYWVMLDVAADALTDATGFKWDQELLHDELKRRLQLGDTYTTPSGHEVFKPRSTSNRAMNETERARWVDRCAATLSHWLGVEVTELMDEARARNGGDDGRRELAA